VYSSVAAAGMLPSSVARDIPSDEKKGGIAAALL
jgi:hypothetical protein